MGREEAQSLMIGGKDGFHGMYPCPYEDDVERARVLNYT